MQSANFFRSEYQLHLTVLKNIALPSYSSTEVLVDFHDIKTWIRSGTILLKLFRYSSVTLRVTHLASINRPLATALILRLLCHGRVACFDDSGRQLTFNLSFFLKKSFFIFLDFLRIQSCIKLNGVAVDVLQSQKYVKCNEIVRKNSPTYLRTDLWFGVKSGGSVGHIAGVLNNLDGFFGKPVFLTTDFIPTVREDIVTTLLQPTSQFWDFSEMPSIASNPGFFKQALSAIGQATPAFIYQRYSVNNYLGARLSKHYKVPFVLEYNGSEIWIARNWGSPLKYEALSEKIENLNLNVADVVVVVSQPMKDELVARHFDAEKILVNPNGVDPERYSPEIDGSKLRNKYGLGDKLVIGFIGTFGHWHGAEVLAEAYRRLLLRSPSYRVQLHLMMIGDGLTLPQVKAIITAHGLDDCCTFTGVVPQAEGPSFLAACDILASPHVPNPDGTPFFGSPTKLFEYMAMGKGIVASKLDQIGEILSHGQTAWLVEPGDAEELATGLERLVNDPTLRDRLGRAARAEVIAKYTWEEHTRRIIEKLEERCGG